MRGFLPQLLHLRPWFLKTSPKGKAQGSFLPQQSSDRSKRKSACTTQIVTRAR